MAKVRFEPAIKWFTGRIGWLVYRRSHSGKISAYPGPDMSGVKWSQAQKDHRQRMKEAFLYASAAVADPDLRPIYVQMAIANNKNPRRPFDIAVSDYYETGNDLLWKKHMGDQEKPKNWDIERYSWYLTRQRPKYLKKRKRQR
jgi:hypothetical protein